jgi:hypothetical protein
MLSGNFQLYLDSNANMSSDKKYFLIPASSGLCIQPGLNRTETAACKGEANQLWNIQEGEDNKVAFRNVGSADYLHAAGGYSSNAVKQGTRQWWTLEVSDTPHAFWFVYLFYESSTVSFHVHY